MSLTNTAARPVSAARPNAEELLRDLAFVLRMSRKVSAEIMAERPTPKRAIRRTDAATPAVPA